MTVRKKLQKTIKTIKFILTQRYQKWSSKKTF